MFLKLEMKFKNKKEEKREALIKGIVAYLLCLLLFFLSLDTSKFFCKTFFFCLFGNLKNMAGESLT